MYNIEPKDFLEEVKNNPLEDELGNRYYYKKETVFKNGVYFIGNPTANLRKLPIIT